MPIQPKSRLVVVKVATRVRLTSTSASYTYLDVPVPELTELLPYVEQIEVVALTENRTANLSWNVFVGSGYTRQFENAASPFALITADLAANGSSRSVPYTTVTNFSLTSRVVLGAKNSTGTAQEEAIVSVTLLLRLIGM